MDLNGDRHIDILSGSWPGELFLFRGGKDRTFAPPEMIKDKEGEFINIGGGIQEEADGGILITGNADFEETPGGTFVNYHGKRIKHTAEKPISITGTASAVHAADWDGDGDHDLIVGDIGGNVYLIPNEGSAKAYAFGKHRPLQAGGRPIRVAGDAGAAPETTGPPMTVDVATVDRGNIQAVVTAVIILLRAHDLEGLAVLAREEDRDLFEAMAEQGDRHPRTKAFYAGWRWQAVEAWDGEVGEIRYWRTGDGVRAEARFGGNGGFIIVVVVILIDDEWTFVGIARSSTAAFFSGSLALPPARRLKVEPTLIRASLRGDLEEVKRLLTAGADPNGKNDEGWTPLHAAAQEGHSPVADLLISNGADVSARGPAGNTPLYMSAQHNRPELASLLLAKGAEIDERDSDGWTSLIFVSQHAHMPLIHVLVAEGADVNARTQNGATALLIAAQNGHADLVEFLLEMGADPTAADDRGWTPLHKVAYAGHRALVDRLLTAGAGVDAKNNEGWTPLHMAAQEGHEEVLEALIAKGASVNAKVNQGATAVDIAEQGGHSGIVGLLERHGGESGR